MRACSKRVGAGWMPPPRTVSDRKSTRLNSSHTVSSYAVFCLKKTRDSARRNRWLACTRASERRSPRGRGSRSFLFNDTSTTDIYTLSLHDALPISGDHRSSSRAERQRRRRGRGGGASDPGARKSTRLNSSHTVSSYAVFCLQK